MGDEPILQFCSDFEDIGPAIEKKSLHPQEMWGMSAEESIWSLTAHGRSMTDDDLRQVLKAPATPPFYIHPTEGATGKRAPSNSLSPRWRKQRAYYPELAGYALTKK